DKRRRRKRGDHPRGGGWVRGGGREGKAACDQTRHSQFQLTHFGSIESYRIRGRFDLHSRISEDQVRGDRRPDVEIRRSGKYYALSRCRCDTNAGVRVGFLEAE